MALRCFFLRVLRVSASGLLFDALRRVIVRLWLAVLVASLAVPAFAQSPNGSTVFTDHCATCHAGTDQRVPTVAALRQRAPEAILDALVTGAMRQQGAELTDAERRAVAEFLGGRPLAAATVNYLLGLAAQQRTESAQAVASDTVDTLAP